MISSFDFISFIISLVIMDESEIFFSIWIDCDIAGFFLFDSELNISVLS